MKGLEIHADAPAFPVARTFEDVVLPHLDAAFNYARWLTNNYSDAEDVVQDAYLRAFRFFSTLRGTDARPWLLAIVRNAWYGRMGARKTPGERDDPAAIEQVADEGADPESLLMRREATAGVRRAIAALPPDFREVLVLREIEGMSYKEIADVIGAPIGTVMSRLSRARERLVPLLGLFGSPGERP